MQGGRTGFRGRAGLSLEGRFLVGLSGSGLLRGDRVPGMVA